MGANNITGSGAVSAGSFSASGTTDASSTSTGTLVTAGGLGVAKKAYVGTDLSVGPVQTMARLAKLIIAGSDGAQGSSSSSMIAYTDADQYPLFEQWNYQHNNITQSYDAYFNGAAWASSNSNSNFQINKASGLYFKYNAGTAAGSTFSWTTAGYIDTSGIMQWQKAIRTADTTASSSTTTGSLVVAGGAGIAGNVHVGGTLVAASANPTARGQQLSLSKCVNTDSSVELKNSTTATTVFTTQSGNLTWAANTTNVGMLVKLTCFFVVTAFGGGGNLAFNLYVDGSSNTGINAPVSAGNWGMFEVWVRVLGSSSILTTSRMTYNNQATQVTGLGPSAIWALTSSHTLDIRAQWSVASASNAVTFYGAFAETINQS
jgi:hypothetical protein